MGAICIWLRIKLRVILIKKKRRKTYINIYWRRCWTNYLGNWRTDWIIKWNIIIWNNWKYIDICWRIWDINKRCCYRYYDRWRLYRVWLSRIYFMNQCLRSIERNWIANWSWTTKWGTSECWTTRRFWLRRRIRLRNCNGCWNAKFW